MIPLQNVTFAFAVKVGSGASSFHFRDSQYNVQLDDDFKFVQVTELKNAQVTVYVPLSNVTYMTKKEQEKKEKK